MDITKDYSIIHMAEKHIVLSEMKDYKKYSASKLCRKLNKKYKLNWKPQRVSAICKRLYEEKELQRMYRKKKCFYIKFP